MKQVLILVFVVLAIGAKWWDPRCPPCPGPEVCRGRPCFIGQRCDEDKGCLPRITGERSFSADTRSLALDATGQGGVALAGSYEDTAEGSKGPSAEQTLVARLSPTGEMKWSTSFGVPGQPDGAEHVRIARDGSIWVAGSFEGGEIEHQGLLAEGTGGRDVYVMKFMGGGRPLWVQGFGTTDDDRILDLDVGEDGNGYLVTSAAGSNGFTVRRVLADGGAGWTKEFPGTAPALGIYREDQLYLAASFNAPTIKVGWKELELKEGGDPGLWLARLDWDGDLVWARSLDGEGRGTPRVIQDVAATDDGDLLISGFGDLDGFPKTSGAGIGFAARLSPAGTPTWVRRFGPRAAPGNAVHISLILGDEDLVHMSGTYDGPFVWDTLLPRPDLDAGSFVVTLESDGSFEAALAFRRWGPLVPMRASLDDAGILHMVAGAEGNGYRLVTVEP